jgi:hypothetical protein
VLVVAGRRWAAGIEERLLDPDALEGEVLREEQDPA